MSSAMIVDALAGCVPEPDAFAAGEATTLGRLRGYAEHFKTLKNVLRERFGSLLDAPGGAAPRG
jgi:hypothetical protein